ncbi:AAA family ATPase [Catellatospora chokoriensis]|uniref:ATPase AAA-type core domain-containing protein n=1 Tax=Catellatospora chokoriensis TaxID=310353 RepID=A0A8J3KGR2_9ACTN|nr:AAA family ATPase [Catellatospora chokoriensis]GIF94764.1 hypothetical protein Cch02nite_82080 [Catellatospora chokoriensis]
MLPIVLPPPLSFAVLPVGHSPRQETPHRCYLVTDNWNDWFTFQTQYYLVYCDRNRDLHHIGRVKIGQFGMTAGQSRPDLPTGLFQELDQRFFSLGQDDNFYANLNELGSVVRTEILSSLRDMAFDLAIMQAAQSEDVTSASLMRDILPATVERQFHRIAHGGERLTPYNFSYISNEDHASRVSFSVQPDSTPPTNVHVLIGRNGVGKTYLINSMANALIFPNAPANVGRVWSDMDGEPSPFVNVVFVSFSAFDQFWPRRNHELAYTYLGLHREINDTGWSDWDQEEPPASATKTNSDLATEFVESMLRCMAEPLRTRWTTAIQLLEADPVFADAEITSILREPWNHGRYADRLFGRLSSGHKIVLLTLTRLVESVTERTLVLMDEPEAHLHPPLLAAFVRALSNLLIDRNGVAVVATHSPVVLQEVPRTCAWKIHRSGRHTVVSRPEVETFGENVGVLTHEVFGLEVMHSSFHTLLRTLVHDSTGYSDVMMKLGWQLGDEGKAIIQAMLAARQPGAWR